MSPRAAKPDTWPTLVEDEWPDTHRLILATYAQSTEPYLATLAEEPDDLEHLTNLAAATNTRLAAQQDRGTLAIGADELIFGVDYSHIVNAAFTYPGRGGRFHDRTRGAWYCSVEVDGCLAEVAHHRGEHLAETSWWDDVAHYQDYTCSVGGRTFADLGDGDARAEPMLDPASYERPQQLAARLLAKGANGVVYPSVRQPGATNVACFRPALLPPVREGGRYQLEWSGPGTPTVTALA